ncbi:MAG TPA: DUF2961 domain-containing protein [Candidatus Hydrogenedentes bacterium]|nr:DUF2961 domain-containing protein [Candidatus Hydrogenedentota bacterium]
MTFSRQITRFFLLSMAVTITAAAQTGQVNLETLLAETVSLERLAVAPSPGYLTRQFSSYDQNSTDPDILTKDNWFANHDRNQHLRVEENQGREEFVLMDAEGPGVVVRFWSANPKEGGVVRFYLDHNEEPAIEMPLYVLLGGQTKPFIAPFSGERGRGWNCYMPIPYAEHCKITISEGDIYYQINYRTYDAAAKVTSFSLAQADMLMKQIREVAAKLAEPYKAVAPHNGQNMPYEAAIDAGDSERMEIRGSGAIYRVVCGVEANDMETALRHCVLTVSFDGEADAVSAPLGDFFGAAPGNNPYQSLPSGVLEDGLLYSHWYMPFKEAAVILVENRGNDNIRLRGEIGFAPREWGADMMYFHAKWRAEKDIPTRPMQDWNYMDVRGEGRFAGVMLHVANPVPDWWGEGDEKIYVDGESFPSHFGTGTEDYFGYAWCNTSLFTHAYHNQARCDGPGNFGHTCVSRFHVMDDIPFGESFRFDMEVWHWAETNITQAITAYWYAAANSRDNFPAIATDLLGVPVLEPPKGVEGALEGEDMTIISASGGATEIQSSTAWTWSGMNQLWWRDAAPGDTLILAFPVEKEGRYEVFAVFTKAKDYGVHQIKINGNEAGQPRDFYNETVVAADEASLGEFDLVAGDNTFEVQVVGSNPDAVAAYMFGLDYIRLEAK